MFSTVRARLTLSHLAVIVIAMGLVGFLLLSFVQRYFLQAMEDSLSAQARLTAQALIPGAAPAVPEVLSSNSAYNTMQQQRGDVWVQTQNFVPPPLPTSSVPMNLDYLADVSIQLSTQLDTRIRVLDPNGVVLIDSLQQEQGRGLQSDPLVQRALAGRSASRTDSLSQKNAAMQLAMPILVEDRLAGIIYLSQPVHDVISVLADLRAYWLLSTAIALLLSGLVGLLLSRAVARPVQRLTVAAQAVAGGQLDHKVPVGSKDEIGQLSRAFNEMTDRLCVARQAQVDFVANVSHELRTPLTSVKGMVETLRDGAADDPEVRGSFLATVEEETDRLIRLVNDLLLLSRADSDALHLERGAVDLAGLADVAIRRLASLAQAREVTLQVEADPGLPAAWVDPDRAGQVFINLLDNAIKYSRPGSTVTVGLASDGDGWLRVQVRDQGIGIRAQDLARVGERFYRTDKARSRAEGGSGLGLSIAQALVQAHGGKLWVESQEGKGTTVNFSLPTQA